MSQAVLRGGRSERGRAWRPGSLVAALVILAPLAPGADGRLVNGDFERRREDGGPLGWTIRTGLDPHRYGPPELRHGFDAIRPVLAAGGHRSSLCLVHGLLKGRGEIDVGADGLVDWIAETEGEEIVDLDVTRLLGSGRSLVRLRTVAGRGGEAEHDFAALLDVLPGVSPAWPRRLELEGDELARTYTRIIDATWFWLRELHYEPSGFVDASVPHGHWHGQYWPVDTAFALREWVRWGHHDESVRIARRAAELGWHGHATNRSGGFDNTAGAILVRELIEVLRRSEPDRDLRDLVWRRVRAFAAETGRAARESPFGLVRGTSWENAGNREHGPCHALSTNLGAAAALRKAAGLADGLGETALADRWRRTGDALRRAVLDRLVLRTDHRLPSGVVLPASTWAYGLREDGELEDRPMAAYLWSGVALSDVAGLRARDPEIDAVYSRTLDVAADLFRAGRRGAVSGYSVSHDGPDATLATAARLDRIDLYGPILDAFRREADAAEDRGSRYAEISRWAQGAPGGAEDTNLVVACGMLWAFRSLVGIDDLLAGDRQLALEPRLPWGWTGLRVRDWPVRFRTADGREAWTRLSFSLERGSRRARLRIDARPGVAGMELRLGPFPRSAGDVRASRAGRPIRAARIRSGDAVWARLRCDVPPGGIEVEVVAAEGGRAPPAQGAEGASIR